MFRDTQETPCGSNGRRQDGTHDQCEEWDVISRSAQHTQNPGGLDARHAEWSKSSYIIFSCRNCIPTRWHFLDINEIRHFAIFHRDGIAAGSLTNLKAFTKNCLNSFL